ncbi:MAG: T9SS type A sorting domain-containing protein [Bacteroidota bacterium]
MQKVNCSSFLCLALISLSVQFSHAQSIYAGGNGDGFSLNGFSQPDNILFNIYSGGNDDGFSISSFAQPDNVLFDIYKGGSDDGFAFNSFAQADNVLFDIYKGGIEDGFALNSFAQADNLLFDIYKGGMEDGFAFSSFAQPDNVLYDIYKGGLSDGFAFNNLGSIGSEVPLPVELVSFEGKYQDGHVLLKWKTASELNNDHFSIERSKDGVEFIELAIVQGAGTKSTESIYQAYDHHPLIGTGYYRLKQTDFDGQSSLSKVIKVDSRPVSLAEVIVFPNPTPDGEITLELNRFGSREEVRISVIDLMGRIKYKVILETDVSGFLSAPLHIAESGVYFISVTSSKGTTTTKLIVR